MNGLHFDEDHIMLVNGIQQVTGIKTFSNHSKLNIGQLEVAGLFNDINITEFYDRQVRIVKPFVKKHDFTVSTDNTVIKALLYKS